jgi:hypothetical protein
METMEKVYRILFWQPEGDKTFNRHGRKLQENIKIDAKVRGS